jgi:APA family basic amino acid/polyamine antiporter
MNPGGELKRKIGLWSAMSIVAGGIIGSGVFMKPAIMAAQVASPVWLTLVWVIAGIFSLFGALIFSELGAMMPDTGGMYVYFRRIFGDFVAFLYGWAAFAVINTAAVAAISFVCATYADYFLQLPRLDTVTELSIAWHIPFIGDLYPLQNIGVKVLAVSIVLVFSFLNYRSVKGGSSFQLISTIIKIAVIGALITGILFSGEGSFQHFFKAPKQGMDLLSGVVVAMTGAFLAYDGWINVCMVAGEIKQPQKNIPKSLILGVFVCIIIYVLVNQAYLYVLPVESLAKSRLVASDAIAVALGNTSGAIVAAMIVICTLGAVNGNLLASCRVTFAMGKERAFLPWVGRMHPRFETPGNAVWLHAIWTILFIITGTFDMLADMFVFITWISYLFGAIGIFVLRRREPAMSRPYKTWGYPFVPILFIAFSAFYLISTIWSDTMNYLNDRQPIINSVLGLVITAAGMPLYYYFKRRNKEVPPQKTAK